MSNDEKFRRDIRIGPANTNFSCFISSVCNQKDKQDPKIILIVDTAFQNLMNEDLDTKFEGLNVLTQMIKSFQKYIIPKINFDVLKEICLTENIEKFSSTSLYFLATLMQITPSFYEFFVTSNFYTTIIQRIQPGINRNFYRQILLFLCNTISKFPESIEMMINSDILINLKNMDQTEFIEELQIIYSSSFIFLGNFSILDLILFYLTLPKIRLINKTLKTIEKCLTAIPTIKNIWPQICFDSRLINLLAFDDFDVISNAISIFSIIFSFSDDSIKKLFEKVELVNQIISFAFHESNAVCMSVLLFLNSIAKSSTEDSNIESIFGIINGFHISSSSFSSLSFACQRQLALVVFNLCTKASLEQVRMIAAPDVIRKAIEIFRADEEDFKFAIGVFEFLVKKFEKDKEFVSFLADTVNDADLDEYMIETE